MEGEAAACGTQSPLLLVVLGEARQLSEVDGNGLYNVFGRNGEGSARERETRHIAGVARGVGLDAARLLILAARA